tara:strand:+ start:12234 stop:13001 length:768 start_codon:yes stop_codon:yes gene_type:complete
VLLNSSVVIAIMSTSTKGKRKRQRTTSSSELTNDDIDELYTSTGLPSVPETDRSATVNPQPYCYKQMDDMIAQYTANHDNGNTTAPEIVCCPRAYEEAFLREPIGSERQCVNNSECQGLRIMGSTGFVLREFILPNAPIPAPNDPRTLCIMCRRFEIARMFFLNESRREPICKNVVISPYYNIIGVDGEYCVEDCIVSEGKYTGLSLPVVLQVRSAYKQCTINGVRGFTQDGIQKGGDCDNVGNSAFLARRATLR